MSFQDLGFLLLPVDRGITGTVIEAGEHWEPLPTRASVHDVVVWGRGPLRSGAGTVVAARSALARERALRSIRRDSPPDRITVHRLQPARLVGRALRARLRGALLGGALVELRSGQPVRRAIDAAAEQAGAGERITAFVPGSGGSVMSPLRATTGQRGLLRVARAGGPVDPLRGGEALSALEGTGLPQVPRLLGRGTAEGVSWTTETLLPGRRPARVSAAVAAEIAELCSALPRSDQPSVAHEEDLRDIARRFPRWEGLLGQASDEVEDIAPAVPSVVRHGDLWAGNLLVRRGRVTGLVDWDAWHPLALPGVDLLHLVATSEELRSRRGLGHVWLRQPWTGERFRSLTADYWTAVRIVPNERFLRGLGVAWWASYVAASLRRLPHLADDGRWVEKNVDRVLEALGRT